MRPEKAAWAAVGIALSSVSGATLPLSGPGRNRNWPASHTSASRAAYAALRDGSPLFAVLRGQEVELKSRRPASQSFSFYRGMTWKASYVVAELW